MLGFKNKKIPLIMMIVTTLVGVNIVMLNEGLLPEWTAWITVSILGAPIILGIIFSKRIKKK